MSQLQTMTRSEIYAILDGRPDSTPKPRPRARVKPRRTLTPVSTPGAIWMYGTRRDASRFHMIGKFDATRAACGRKLAVPSTSIEPPEHLDLCDACVLADYESPAVYRFLDTHGDVLYIGCTRSLFQRLMSHACSSESAEFWPLVARIDFTTYSTIEEALVAEFDEIAAVQPPYNTRHTDRDPRPWRHAARRAPGNRPRASTTGGAA